MEVLSRFGFLLLSDSHQKTIINFQPALVSRVSAMALPFRFSSEEELLSTNAIRKMVRISHLKN